MTRQIPLPTAETVAEALQDLTRQANVTGLRVSVSGLARHLGLPNTTLRRHYPDVIDEMGTAGPSITPAAATRTTRNSDRPPTGCVTRTVICEHIWTSPSPISSD